MDATSRRVLKVMGIFTSVEMAGIVCSMVKMKLVAMWLDATGVGLFNIFNSTIDTTTYLTGLGLRQSAVRDLSGASRKGEGMLRRMVERVRAWSVAAGLLGAVVLAALAWPLAEIIFGDGRMWWNFMVLGGAMLLNALYAGESAIFQATEGFKRLARSGLGMAVAGLVVSVPMFRFMGEASVAWSLLAYSLCGVIFAYINRDRRFAVTLPRRKDLQGEQTFLKFGAFISITAFINSLCQLAFSTWLNREASTAEVGLYSAGYILVMRYTSLVFNSVSLEYYPRVAACGANRNRMEVFMNHEVSLLLLLFTPLMLLFLLFRELIVEILYDADFLVILPFISWGILTVVLRGASNTMAYTIMAKGEGKVYMFTDVVDAVLGLGLSIWLYSELGLTGIGVAMVVWHGVYMLIVEGVCRRRYGLYLRSATLRLLTASFLTAGIALVLVLMTPALIHVPVLAIAACVYIWYFARFLGRHGRRRIIS